MPRPRCASQASIGPGTAPPRVRAARSAAGQRGVAGADVAEHARRRARPAPWCRWRRRGRRPGPAGAARAGSRWCCRRRAARPRRARRPRRRRCRRRRGRGWTASPAAPAPAPSSAPSGHGPAVGTSRTVDAERRQLVVGERAGQVVAVGRQHERAVGRRASRSTARDRGHAGGEHHALAAVERRRSPPPARARSGCRRGRRSRSGVGSAGSPRWNGADSTGPGCSGLPGRPVAAARRARTAVPSPDLRAARRSPYRLDASLGRGARLISSLPIAAADSPSWQTRRTASAIGSSTPWRSPSSQIDAHDFTPSATWPWLASSASASARPRPEPLAERPVARQRRRAGRHQVAQPGQARRTSSGRRPAPRPSRAVSASPRVISEARRVVPEAHPGGHPAGQRDHVLAGAAELAADHVGVGVGPEVAGGAGVLQRRPRGRGRRRRSRWRSAPRRRSRGPGSARTPPRPGPAPTPATSAITSLIRLQRAQLDALGQADQRDPGRQQVPPAVRGWRAASATAPRTRRRRRRRAPRPASVRGRQRARAARRRAGSRGCGAAR